MTATMTKETSLMFTDPMVRAIIDGSKTQTRRMVKPQPRLSESGSPSWKSETGHRIRGGPRSACGGPKVSMTELIGEYCPYGQPGDLLWVQEGVWTYDILPVGRNRQFRWPKFEKESHAREWFNKSCEYTSDWKNYQPLEGDGGLLNKMFMPRWASRLTLEVTDVRVERVQDISEADAKAEGVKANEVYMHDAPDHWARTCFRALWNSINGKKAPWDSNPWVWVVSFKKVGDE